MRVDRCDNCGKETVDSRRFAYEAREAAYETERDFISIHVEHNEDVLHLDACSWACLADLALRRATDSVADGVS
jgi:hypothetical protein